MSTCNHNSSIPSNVIESLHYNQAGFARHKCPNCAYQQGVNIGAELRDQHTFDELYSELTFETCHHEKSAPTSLVSQWYNSQGGEGRHKCAICAFREGLTEGYSTTQDDETSNIHHISFPIIEFNTREKVRNLVIDAFLNEQPGTGTGQFSSKYIYCVENIHNVGVIELRRPAFLHWGFDFLVCLKEHNFNPEGRFRDYPKHEELISDLEFKKGEDIEKYANVYESLERIFFCRCANISELDVPVFSNGLDVKILYGLFKWLFIEQDIRYWNYSGRSKLWEGIPRP